MQGVSTPRRACHQVSASVTSLNELNGGDGVLVAPQGLEALVVPFLREVPQLDGQVGARRRQQLPPL
eukprot:scaffold650_cov249-Pinguiococcus_pyrenoidosus.AAC.13